MSPQKARLVVDLIRGKNVNEALMTLRFTNKRATSEIEKVVRSAVANASQKSEAVDVDNLFVETAFINEGPRQKRIRPAPMGRAFRVLKRTAHLTVQVAERPLHIETAPAPAAQTGAAAPAEATRASASTPKRPRGAKPKPKAAAKGRAKTGSKTGGAKKKAAAKSGRAKKAKA